MFAGRDHDATTELTAHLVHPLSIHSRSLHGLRGRMDNNDVAYQFESRRPLLLDQLGWVVPPAQVFVELSALATTEVVVAELDGEVVGVIAVTLDVSSSGQET